MSQLSDNMARIFAVLEARHPGYEIVDFHFSSLERPITAEDVNDNIDELVEAIRNAKEVFLAELTEEFRVS